MTGQLVLDLQQPAPPSQPTSQLTDLPGTQWEHIFDMPAPGDDAMTTRERAWFEGDA